VDIRPSKPQEEVSTRRPPISLFKYSPAVILVMIVFVNTGRTTDPDFWAHIRYGQALLKAKHVIVRDPYSYSAAGHEWRDHESLIKIARYMRVAGPWPRSSRASHLPARRVPSSTSLE
jgi:hypothetical protein